MSKEQKEEETIAFTVPSRGRSTVVLVVEDDEGSKAEGPSSSGEVTKDPSTLPPPPPPSDDQKGSADDKTSSPGTPKTPEGSPSSTGGEKRRRRKIVFENARFGLIGAGKLGEAIVRGLIYQKVPSKTIFVACRSEKSSDVFKELNCVVVKRNYDIFGRLNSDVVFLATHGIAIRECFKTGGTRPQAFCVNYIPLRSRPYYVLSAIGGVTTKDIRSVLLNPDEDRKYRFVLHRIMLNTACSRGLGLGAIDAEIDSKRVAPIVRETLLKLARIEYCAEPNMDVLCALGGSGLAFVYYFINALSDGGFKLGLPAKQSLMLAIKTIRAAAESFLDSGKDINDLRDACLAPSGPGVFGMMQLTKQDTSAGISNAVESAFKRIKELAEKPLN